MELLPCIDQPQSLQESEMTPAYLLLITCHAYLAIVLIHLCIEITINIWRVATPLDIDQERSVLHHIFHQVTIIIVRVSMALSSFQVRPLILLDILHPCIVQVWPPWCVGHSDLVTFVDLCRAALATACPAAVRSSISHVIAHHLKGKNES